ncbi:hypothetical protein [Bacillus paranthracis]|uniref:hypothetical protein n=1 Tax=Bacillus paranthracis TaxID=2026186 RepID=UPI0022DEE3C1|nr:hypothetical protein [Bacillus paranthracis]
MTRLYSVPCVPKARFYDDGTQCHLMVTCEWVSPVSGRMYTNEMNVFSSRPKEFVEKFKSSEDIDAAITAKGDYRLWVKGAMAIELRRELFELENSAGSADVQRVADLINAHPLELFTAEVDLDRD